MLIIPVAEKFTWKNPPIITLLLILINVIVFTGFQSQDNEAWQQAVEYYFNSGLGAIEVPFYEDYRKEKEKPIEFPGDKELSEKERNYIIFGEMEHDESFQKLLRHDRVVTEQSSSYSQWKKFRREFLSLKEGIFTNRYQFVPADHKPVTFASHMFLHGSYGHLFGNMLFLWLFGCILEIGCGRARYLLMYLLTGFGAVSFFWVFNLGGGMGLVGASGAISGLMGAYTVLFGKSRIKLFMYLGFYFNYMRIPAILLLPFWLFREVYALLLGPANNVAYTAHIGGIIAGALSGFLILKYSDFKKHEVFKEEPPDRITPMMEEALEFIGKLEFDKGKVLLEQVLQEDRLNYSAFEHLYALEKQSPHTDDYQNISKRYLIALCANEEVHDRIFPLYEDYRRLATPKLSAELYISLCIIFSKIGHLDTAEKIIEMVLRKKPDLPKIPTALLKLSHAFGQKKHDDKCLKYREILCTQYPDTQEASLILKATS